VYDGRKPFGLSTYGSLWNFHDELDANSTVMVIFTISSYRDNQGREPDDLVLSFNIQDVILLADYNPATELSAITFSDVIGVEAEEVVKNMDLQDVLGGLKRLTRKKFKDSSYVCRVQRHALNLN
jgi:hypothetical protein